MVKEPLAENEHPLLVMQFWHSQVGGTCIACEQILLGMKFWQAWVGGMFLALDYYTANSSNDASSDLPAFLDKPNGPNHLSHPQILHEYI